MKTNAPTDPLSPEFRALPLEARLEWLCTYFIMAGCGGEHYSAPIAEARRQLELLRKERDAALKATPAASVWRPVSERPTREDGDTIGEVLAARPAGIVLVQWSRVGLLLESHWTRTADLLACCPLPRELSQEEILERDFNTQALKGGWPITKETRAAFEAGRGTAAKEAK